jgi:sugar-specific transcriptional regulator TrmB
MNTIISSSLVAIGFSEFDADVYEALLTISKPSVTHLSKTFKVSRTKIYSSLKRLAAYELVNFELDFLGEIRVASPAKISTLLKYKNLNIQNVESRFNEYLPDILNNYESTIKTGGVKVYQGAQNFENLVNLVLDQVQDEIYFLGNMDGFYNLLGWDYLDQFGFFRRKKNVHLKMLVFKTNGTIRFQRKDKDELRETRFLPEKYLNQGVIWFYKDTVINWNPLLTKAIYIHDSVLFEFYKQMFEMSWENSLKV